MSDAPDTQRGGVTLPSAGPGGAPPGPADPTRTQSPPDPAMLHPSEHHAAELPNPSDRVERRYDHIEAWVAAMLTAAVVVGCVLWLR